MSMHKSGRAVYGLNCADKRERRENPALFVILYKELDKHNILWYMVV